MSRNNGSIAQCHLAPTVTRASCNHVPKGPTGMHRARALQCTTGLTDAPLTAAPPLLLACRITDAYYLSNHTR